MNDTERQDAKFLRAIGVAMADVPRINHELCEQRFLEERNRREAAETCAIKAMQQQADLRARLDRVRWPRRAVYVAAAVGWALAFLALAWMAFR